MLSQRQKKLLVLIIDEYIKNAEPISSQLLLDKHKLNVSSATIRNEMVELEKKGYIEKAHSSSGRIPTNKAYEWNISERKTDENDPDNIKRKLNLLFVKRDEDIESTFTKALEIISNSTKTAVVSYNKTKEKAKLQDLKFYKLKDTLAMILIVLDDGSVFNQELKIKDKEAKDVETLIKIFSQRLIGVEIFNLEKRALLLQDVIKEQIKSLEERFFDLVKMLFTRLNLKEQKYSGLNNIVEASYIKSLDVAKKVLKMIENQTIWELIDKSENKIETEETKIALDLPEPDFKNISIVNKEIEIGASKKNFALVGPRHQDYNQVIELINFLEKKIKDELK